MFLNAMETETDAKATTTLTPSIITTIFLATIVIIAFKFFHYHRRQQQQSSGSNNNKNNNEITIETCANPNCARCIRYKELNRIAQRRLPWLLKSYHQGQKEIGNGNSDEDKKSTIESSTSPFERIIDAVQNGPVYNANDTTTTLISDNKATGDRDTSISPIKGQPPTVLLIRGLSVSSSFHATTSLHSHVCSILEGCYEEESVRDVILKEYFAAVSGNNETGAVSSSWLNNDVVAINDDSIKTNTSKTILNPMIQHSSSSSSWRVLHFQNQGKWMAFTLSQCPKTTTIIQSLPNIMTNCIFGNIFLSVLTPNTKITPHCGPCNVRHRLHFPLLVPFSADNEEGGKDQQQPELHVMNEVITWKEGKCFVFDDSLVHFAIYPPHPPKRQQSTTTPRVLLIVDLWHPDLNQEERDMISELYPAATPN